MTTTAKPKTKAPKHDLSHGPVAAAFNASVWPLFIATLGKATGVIPPWSALAAAALLAGCLVAAGIHRQPRPLSRVSLIYRASVVMTIGGWLWWQLGTVGHADLTPGQTAALLVTWPATLAGFVCAVAARRMLPPFRLLMPAVPLLVAVVLTVMQHAVVFAWLRDVLLLPNRFDPGWSAPFSWFGAALIEMAILAAPLAVLGVTFANRERSADEELARLQRNTLPRTAGEQGRVFLKMICKLTNEYTEWRPTDPTLPGRKIPNLSVTDVRFWDNNAGETYIVDLTRNERGTTRTRLRGFTDEVATKLNLPYGCGVEVMPAKQRDGEPMGAGFAAVDISRVNVLKLKLDYPKLQPRSIMNPMPLGRTRSDKEIGPYFREASAYVWGQKGSGKTGTMFDIVAGAMQCTDCLVWVIDLNRGAVAKPFLRAFADGRVERPCVDWVATTIEEVVHMAQVGLAIALHRKSYYSDLKFELNTNLMPVGNGVGGNPPPEVLIVIDEGATVLGMAGGNQNTDEGRAAAEALGQIMDLARDAAVNIAFSGLRATSDVAGTAFMRGTSIRIGMRVTDDAELGHGFGDYKLSGRNIPYTGSGYIRCGHNDGEEGDDMGDDIQVFKAYYLDPKRMDAVGEEVTPWRPYLDPPSRRVAGTVYANRWRRTAGALWDNPRPEVLNYGVDPRRGDDTVIDGEVVNPAGSTPGAVAAPPAAPVAVDPLTKLRAAGVARPDAGAGGSFEDMMRQAERDRLAREQRGADKGGAEAPPAPPEPYQPPAGRPAPDAAVEMTAEQMQEKFKHIAENMSVLDGEPQRPWSRSGSISPEEEIAAAPTASREILENLVLIHGPIATNEMHALLISGGDHGPAVKISKQAMHKLLKVSGAKDPAPWLAPRQLGDPYNHRKNIPG